MHFDFATLFLRHRGPAKIANRIDRQPSVCGFVLDRLRRPSRRRFLSTMKFCRSRLSVPIAKVTEKHENRAFPSTFPMSSLREDIPAGRPRAPDQSFPTRIGLYSENKKLNSQPLGIRALVRCTRQMALLLRSLMVYNANRWILRSNFNHRPLGNLSPTLQINRLDN